MNRASPSSPYSCRPTLARRVVGHLDVLDPDGLCVYKSVCTEVRQLATVATVFDATDGNARVGSSEPIDEDAAGVEIARDFPSQRDVSGPEIAAQTELACIGRTDGRIN